MKNQKDAYTALAGTTRHSPPVYRPQLGSVNALQRVAVQKKASGPPVFRATPVRAVPPPVYRPQPSSNAPIQRVAALTAPQAHAAIQKKPSAPPAFRPGPARLAPPPVYRPGQGGQVQMRQTLPPFAQSIVQDQGHNRYNRLVELLKEAPFILRELKDVRSYELPASTKAGKWYESLWAQLKKAEQWEKENRPKNAYAPIVVPDDIYYPLAEECVSYRRELNDSYRKFGIYIVKEDASNLEKYAKEKADDEGSDDEDTNPLSVPKRLFRWVSTEEASRAKKQGITYDPIGGGIPTSTKSSKGVAVTSGAVALNKCLVITTSKIPGFKFEYVPTKSKLKEVKIKCDVPADAIE